MSHCFCVIRTLRPIQICSPGHSVLKVLKNCATLCHDHTVDTPRVINLFLMLVANADSMCRSSSSLAGVNSRYTLVTNFYDSTIPRPPPPQGWGVTINTQQVWKATSEDFILGKTSLLFLFFPLLFYGEGGIFCFFLYFFISVTTALHQYHNVNIQDVQAIFSISAHKFNTRKTTLDRETIKKKTTKRIPT